VLREIIETQACLSCIASGYGWVSFRYYYNPVADDRRLVFDPERNLLKPGPGAGFDEVIRYRTYER
jgi:hypothetical protein